MLRVTVEHIPNGDEMHRKIVGCMEIANDETGTSYSGHYRYRISDTYSVGRGRVSTEVTGGNIRGFDRGNQHAWALVRGILIGLRDFTRR